MIFPLAELETFCSRLIIPSRDSGSVPLVPLYGTQRHMLREIAAGFEAGVHDFVTLKGGRQVGGTTVADAIALYWPQKYDGIQGMQVSDDESNTAYRRDVLRQMLASLPAEWRYPVELDNKGILRWANGSRLMFAYAGKRGGGEGDDVKKNLGRGRGLNFLHADEVGSWPDQSVVSALRASLSEHHPRRFSLWNSTARGHGVFHEMVKTAQKAVSQRFVFLAWWQHQGYVARRESAVFAVYGQVPPTSEERAMMREVAMRFGHEITMEQLAWYRWKRTEGFHGDETMMAQEFGSVPEECFQAFGTKFLALTVIRALSEVIRATPSATGYDYDWHETLDDTRVIACDPDEAPLRVWEEPDPQGVYVVGAHPAFSSSPHAPDDVVAVFRAYPDQLVQVAEYVRSGGGPTYQTAWVCLHMIGAYRTWVPAYFALEMAGTGQAVQGYMNRVMERGYGFSTALRTRNREVQDLMGSINYLYRRMGSFTASAALQWESSPALRPRLLNGMRDEVELGHVVLRSEAMVEELSALRRGERGDNDEIGGSGTVNDCRAHALALAVEHWVNNAARDIEQMVAPKAPTGPETVGEALVGGYLASLLTRGRV